MRSLIFFVRTLVLSFLSLIQAFIHFLYEMLSRPRIDAKKSVLIIQLGQIGDFILTQPLFNLLKHRHGDDIKLAVLIDSVNEKLAKNNASIDVVYLYNPAKYSRALDGKYSFPHSELKENKFDAAIWLRGDLRTFFWLLNHLIPIKSITRFSNPLRWSWIPLITGKGIRKKFPHYIEQLNFVYDGVEATYDEMQLRYIRPKRNDFLKIIFLHVSAGSEIRSWPEKNYSTVCCMLAELDQNISIRLIGSQADSERAERIRNTEGLLKYGNRILNLCGKVDLTGLTEIFATGDLYIGFDSGPMHIASSAGIPIVAIMGPQSPQLFRPWGKQEIRVIYKNYFCSPCWQFACLHVQSGPGACVLAIQPEEVFDTAKAILQKGE